MLFSCSTNDFNLIDENYRLSKLTAFQLSDSDPFLSKIHKVLDAHSSNRRLSQNHLMDNLNFDWAIATYNQDSTQAIVSIEIKSEVLSPIIKNLVAVYQFGIFVDMYFFDLVPSEVYINELDDTSSFNPISKKDYLKDFKGSAISYDLEGNIISERLINHTPISNGRGGGGGRIILAEVVVTADRWLEDYPVYIFSGDHTSDTSTPWYISGDPGTNETTGGSGTIDGTPISTYDSEPVDLEELIKSLWEEDICTTEEFDSNDCVKEIWNTMKESDVGYETIKNYIGEHPTAELCLNIKDLGGDVNGNTSTTGTYSDPVITINLNSQNLERSKLSIARTLLHEMIHAELYGMVIEARGYDNFHNYSQNYNNDFLAVWNYIEEFSINGWQHEYMADYYIRYISTGLQKLEKYYVSESFKRAANDGYFHFAINEDWNWNSFYTYVAWEGLHETEQFQNDIIDKDLKNKYDKYRDSFESSNSVNLDCQ